MKTRPYITERLFMDQQSLNQIKQSNKINNEKMKLLFYTFTIDWVSTGSEMCLLSICFALFVVNDV